MAVQYRIGEFSDLSGVSTKTLRFYDEIGLLRPASVDSRTGYRRYRSQQLEELASILALKSLGLSLADVQNQLSKARRGEDRRELLLELRRTVEKSIQTASQSLQCIDAVLAELDSVKRPIPVVVKRRPDIPIASVRAKVKNYEEILRFEQELLNDLPGRSIGDLRGVLWHRCADSGSLEGEPFVALKHKVPFRSFYDVKQLPAATVACAYAGLDDDTAEQSYDAIRKWMNLRNYQLAGPKREIYLDQMLEIQFPLKPA
ncbi:MAG TPA: MerR family transcriptional regulator [Candidatus Eisenbacteria bacterium]|jgi:DNA-binding transcriptional MerR regulator|nr:MerR family transcriptional regulator [Candidatus Eisenbacteria bacterium]